jgi:hypothetical protein
VRVDPHAQHAQASGEVVLPQLLVPLGVAVSAEDVVHEHVEPTLLRLDLTDEAGHLVRLEVIDAKRGPFPAHSGDQLAGLLYRLGPVDLRAAGGAAAAAGGVDVRARAGELDGDCAPGSAGGSGD